MNDSKDHKAAAEPPLDCLVGRCCDCRYLEQDEQCDDIDYRWAYYCSNAGGRKIDSSIFDGHPEWCPLVPNAD